MAGCRGRGYRFNLRSIQDIRVLQTPPWWNLRRLFFAIAGLLGIVLAGSAWLAILRRRVTTQTLEIRRVLEEEAERDKRAITLRDARSRVLESMNSRELLGRVLGSVTALVEQRFEGLRSCIHLLGESGDLEIVANSCFPSDLAAKLAKLAVKSDDEVCSRAASRRASIASESPVESCSSPILSSSGDLLGVISAFDDIGARLPASPATILEQGAHLAAMAIENRRLFSRLKHHSQHDALTGLPNRTLLDERLASAIEFAGRVGSHVAVAYLDLDGFKQVNDVHGHGIGDVYLQKVAERFRSSLREGDLLARKE